MNISNLPLAKIFWTIFGLEVLAVGAMLALAFASFAKRSGPDGGLVGAWIVLIPVAALAFVAALFIAFRAPWARAICILLLLWPFVGSIVGAPIHFLKQKFEEFQSESSRLGAHIFPESGQRKLAAAIANRDVAAVKAAIPGAGDLNQAHSQKLPYYVPLGDSETLLSFACQSVDDSDASVEVLQILLKAGANPNLPTGVPLSAAIFRSTRAVEELVREGADIHAVDGYGQPIWWYAIGHEASNVKRLETLLKLGASIQQRDRAGATALDYAAENGWWRSAYLLAQHVPNAKDLLLGHEKETVLSKLGREVKALEESNRPVPEDMARALAFFTKQ